MKDQYIQKLYETLKESGVCTGKTWAGPKQWVLRRERQGRIKLRRDPFNRRRVNDQELAEIVKEFSVGGTGYWSWDKSLKPTSGTV